MSHARSMFVTVLIAIALIAPPAAAQQPQQPKVFELTVAPSAAPSPALKYRLMPAPESLTPGNAATLYFQAITLGLKEEEKEQLAGLMDVPVERLNRDAARVLLECKSGAIELLHIAARRERCDWDPSFREQGFRALIPEVGALRDMGRLLALQARLQIAEGKFDDAARTLQTAYAMAHHVQQDGVLINALVSAAVTRQLDGVVREWIAVPNSPNLFWAISELPTPFVDIRSAMARERAILVRSFPILKDPERATADQLLQVLAAQNEINAPGGGGGAAAPALDMVALTAQLLPTARQTLIDRGLDKQQVESLPPANAVAIYCATEFQRLIDDVHKWFALPYPQAAEGLRQTEQAIMAGNRSNPLLSFLPAVTRAHASCVAADREFAALQAIEAVRAHMAANRGTLPKALDEIMVLPVPSDPMTGEPFVYHVQGDDTFTLETAQLGLGSADLKYEVTVRR